MVGNFTYSYIIFRTLKARTETKVGPGKNKELGGPLQKLRMSCYG